MKPTPAKRLHALAAGLGLSIAEFSPGLRVWSIFRGRDLLAFGVPHCQMAARIQDVAGAEVVTVSTLELARVRYPGGRVTSGTGQDYLRRLDKIFQPNRFRAVMYPRTWASGPLLTDIRGEHSFNLTSSEAAKVVRTCT